ncbi:MULTISPECIES: SE1832 family protein [Rummeliibacillus]|jgi:hypothetical protein|uniref:SE1832 family protein n=1 Tax=Rummeliibacillus TaxID=648802 RepID=UPI0011B3FA43|nr:MULTISPECIES: SE1832 family protein [Rummeliibacillus]MBO2537561.1 hypothetical protein [Rummeliibacillus suwonensis]
MPMKDEILFQIAELKSDYIRQQGDIEKLESTGYPELIEKAEKRLADMEQQLAELNKQLKAYE